MVRPLPVLADNPSVNATIWRCLDAIGSDVVQRRYVRLFKQNRSDNWQVMNLFRQLVIGGYLAESGYAVEPDPPLEGLTPDWLARGDSDFAIEVFTHYVDAPTRGRLESGSVALINDAHNLHRLHQSLSGKASKHRQAAETMGIGMVLAVCLDFSVMLEPQQVEESIRSPDGLFASDTGVSGVVVHQELSGRHEFLYCADLNARRPARLSAHCRWERSK